MDYFIGVAMSADWPLNTQQKFRLKLKGFRDWTPEKIKQEHQKIKEAQPQPKTDKEKFAERIESAERKKEEYTKEGMGGISHCMSLIEDHEFRKHFGYTELPPNVYLAAKKLYAKRD